jgi:hypothetical protein
MARVHERGSLFGDAPSVRRRRCCGNDECGMMNDEFCGERRTQNEEVRTTNDGAAGYRRMDELARLIEEYVEAGRRHVPRRQETVSKFLPELLEFLGLHGLNWTSWFGRSFQYEFFISEHDPEVSLLVEISSVVEAAFVYYGYRYYEASGRFRDHCADEPTDPGQANFRKMAADFLTGRGYEILPHELRARVLDEKSLGEWIIYDPED